jgi:hypothetical protein
MEKLVVKMTMTLLACRWMENEAGTRRGLQG